tara:strand:- start:24 stop:467 length:444 start_codon:yes stop_codon:yes gene_type:complete
MFGFAGMLLEKIIVDEKGPAEAALAIVSGGSREVGVSGGEEIGGKGVAVGGERLAQFGWDGIEKGFIGDRGMGSGGREFFETELEGRVIGLLALEKSEGRKFYRESRESEDEKEEPLHWRKHRLRSVRSGVEILDRNSLSIPDLGLS